MDAESRVERKVKAQERKYSSRYKPKQVGRSVFIIQAVQAKRAEQVKDGRVITTPSRPRMLPTALRTYVGAVHG